MPQTFPNKTSQVPINSPKSKRASRYQRPRPIPMRLTQRDEQMISRCWEDKLLSTSDLHTLFFGAKARCIYRLRILYSNYYLDRYFFPILWPYRGSTEALYTSGVKGNSIVSLLKDQDQNYVALKRREFKTSMESPGFLLTFRHLRVVNHTRINFEKAFEQITDWKLLRWIPERLVEDQYETLVRMSGMRWPIETSFEFGKQFIGLGDYEVRSWCGWHHHMTLSILAHFSLVRMQLKLKENAPALTLPQVHLLLAVLLPKRHFDVQWALEILEYRQKRNHAAYLSHRKRRLEKFPLKIE